MTEQKESKKARVLKLKELHPDLTGKALAELAGCTPARVSQLIGTRRIKREPPTGS